DDQQPHAVRHAPARSADAGDRRVELPALRRARGDLAGELPVEVSDLLAVLAEDANRVDIVGIVRLVLEDEPVADATTWNDRLAITAVGVAMALAGNVAEEVFEGSHSRRDSSTGVSALGPAEGAHSIARHLQNSDE